MNREASLTNRDQNAIKPVIQSTTSQGFPSNTKQNPISSFKVTGDEIWKSRMEKINSELFTLTYGSLVVQLFKDYENWGEVNKQLEKMGFNMGTRLIEEFLAKSGAGKCQDFRETMEWISKVGFKMFLNMTPQVNNWSPDFKECSLVIDPDSANPFIEFVQLPEEAMQELWYMNILTGVLKGALEMVHMNVEIRFVSDVLRRHDTTELRCKFIRMLDEEVPAGDD